jgi:hypothetical protein
MGSIYINTAIRLKIFLYRLGAAEGNQRRRDVVFELSPPVPGRGILTDEEPHRVVPKPPTAAIRETARTVSWPNHGAAHRSRAVVIRIHDQ